MIRFLVLIVSLIIFQAEVAGDEVVSQASDSKTLIVGISVEPPFVIDNVGRFDGICIDLWKMVAKSLGWEWRYEQYTLSELLEKVKAGEVDVGLGAITRTSEREQDMDFSASYISTGLSMVTLKEPVRNVFDVLSHLGDSAFLQLTASLLVICIVFGLLIWWVERRQNTDHFGGQAAHGFGSGIWWSMVTMSTVGYGDKAPRTVSGRVLALVWIFLSIILLSAFTGTVASSMTMGRLGPRVSNVQDLRGMEVGSLKGSDAAAWLRQNNIHTVEYERLKQGLDSVLNRSIDVFVGERSALGWLVTNVDSDMGLIIQGNLHPERLSFAFPSGSQNLEQFNVELLRVLESRTWRYVLAEYGEQELLIEK